MSAMAWAEASVWSVLLPWLQERKKKSPWQPQMRGMTSLLNRGRGSPLPADGCPWIVDKGCAGLVPDTPPSWSTVPPRQAKVPGFLSFAGGMELHHLVLLGVFVGDTAFQKTHLHVKQKRKNSQPPDHNNYLNTSTG